MAAPLLSLRLDHQAEFALSTLGEDDRRRVEGWFEHIRHWNDDEYIRTRSQKLKPDEELYAFQPSGLNLIVFFSINGDEATILSVASSDWLRYFQQESNAV